MDEDFIVVADQHYILATSSRRDDRTRVLKHGETFGVFDAHGDIHPLTLAEAGLYHEGTRFLSRLELRIGSKRPMLLSSTVRQDNDLLTVDLTNPDLTIGDALVLPRGLLHLHRTRFLWKGNAHEQLRLTQFGTEPVAVSLALRFDADYSDIFEVRGSRRARRGRRLEALVEGPVVVLGYEGLDGVVRSTRIAFSTRPTELVATGARLDLAVDPGQTATVELTVACNVAGARPAQVGYTAALGEAAEAVRGWRAGQCRLETTNEQFNDWISRSVADLFMMTSDTPEGPYPYAGVPWFSVPFGRDGILTALEMLWAVPEVARGVLRYLAAMQATEIVPEQDAEPGKILHETRRGEMAALGEVPFGRYYGSVDSTPLFVMLAGAYYERTGDRPTIEALWHNVEDALRWIDRYGDMDGDGFVEYARRTPKGLVQQGWKDSHDSVFHADGSSAEPPIALAEVQGYAYAARRAGAELARVVGRPERAEKLIAQARRLKEQFEARFWCEELGTYALALDGGKRPCRIKSSNAGHCLYTGIASRSGARRTARTLLGRDSFSGWGIRTVAEGQARYNPMSYHNGSIWPHDNAIIAAGFARYGLKHAAFVPLAGLFDASTYVDLHRLPELFCGFPRRPGEGPTLYPVACAPQAWAAAAPFLLLAACLGLSVDGCERRIRIAYPQLPETLDEVTIRDLRVGEYTIDLLFERHPHDVGITVLKRDGDIKVVVVK